MPKLRAFIAVEASEGVASQVAKLIKTLSAVDAPINWVAPHQLHWTLKFLGDVDMMETAEICRRLDLITRDVAPIELHVGGLGAFPNVDRPRTLWVAADEGSEQLAELHAAIDKTLGEMGFNREQRRFSAHLTIGRVRGTQGVRELNELLEAHSDFSAGSMWAEELVFFSSELQRSGPIYEAIGRVELRGT